MWKFNKSIALLSVALLPFLNFGQQCNLIIKGKIVDASTGLPLANATVSIEKTKFFAASDSLGNFKLKNLCAAGYHIRFSHLGCAPEVFFLNLKKDTNLVVFLAHHSELINEVDVHADAVDADKKASNTIGATEIVGNANKNLAQSIENIAGVGTLNTGSGISKPIIHGLYGNRVSIINNGIAQSGQQWGNDHAPEIDPFVANHISVIKGASALAYGGVSLGGVVLVEPAAFTNEPHLHGKSNYVFQTNGLGHTLNALLEQSAKWGSWRVIGTAKYIGDKKSPNYYLTNTGNRELDFAFQYEKNITNRWKISAYYSHYQTVLGILRGSHISNISDLESAMGRDEPFFTKDYFSYQIEAPYQNVKHRLLKLETKYLLSDNQIIEVKYGGQINDREEFDVRRSNFSESPSLSLQMLSNFLEGAYAITFRKNWMLKSGIQYFYIDNTNDNSATSRMPLIPDYRSNQGNIYLILQKEHGKLSYELGGRIDYRSLEVVQITPTYPREIVRHNHQFKNYSLSAGAGYTFTPRIETKLDIGFVQRAPEVNELYSSGLHQGLASVEYGNPNLLAENSFKALLSADFSINKNVFVQLTSYYQPINDYIYLKPTGEYELNISGSFPIYIYDQTDAQIYGFDVLASYQTTENIKIVAKYAYLKGDDVRNDVPLIFMPPNNFYLSLNYAAKDFGKWGHNSVAVNGKYVAKQGNLLPSQDFMPAPDAYFLLGAELNTSYHLGKNTLDFGLRIENMLNTVYRDYLNRLRYFADDIGINVSLRATYNF